MTMRARSAYREAQEISVASCRDGSGSATSTSTSSTDSNDDRTFDGQRIANQITKAAIANDPGICSTPENPMPLGSSINIATTTRIANHRVRTGDTANITSGHMRYHGCTIGASAMV